MADSAIPLVNVTGPGPRLWSGPKEQGFSPGMRRLLRNGDGQARRHQHVEEKIPKEILHGAPMQGPGNRERPCASRPAPLTYSSPKQACHGAPTWLCRQKGCSSVIPPGAGFTRDEACDA